MDTITVGPIAIILLVFTITFPYPLGRNDDIKSNHIPESMFDVVLAMIGDSPAPSLALVNSNISKEYIFFCTTEMEENAMLLEKYLGKKSPGLSFEIHPIPSMNDPTGIILSAKNFVYDLNQDVHAAIFLTSGAKQVTLPFYIHAPYLTTISLKEGREANQPPSFLLIQEPNGPERVVETSTTFEEILAIRGWSMHPTEPIGLVKGDQHLGKINAEYNEKSGRITFFVDSYSKLNSVTKPIPKKKQKKIQSYDHDLIGQLVMLSKSFGRNGAIYSIRGDLGKRIRNVLPYFIRHERDFNEEEE